MEPVIQTHDLTKQYGKNFAVNKVSICVNRGDIYGLIGKNGAGKTTLIKMLLGLTTANSGNVSLFAQSDLSSARLRIGSLVESPAIYKNESAYENMKRFAILTDASRDDIDDILTFVGLSHTGKKKAGEFSLGMKQRLGIAIALLGKPELLILDEPINGLDPAGIKDIRDLILKLNSQGISFMISSHLLDELGKIATRYGVLANGHLVEEIDAMELKEKCQGSLKILTNDGDAAFSVLSSWQKDLKLQQHENVIQILQKVDSAEVNERLVQAGVRVSELQPNYFELEDYFIERMR